MVERSTRTASVREHYDRLLGPVYSWIMGDFDAACRSSAELFARLAIRSEFNASALDLGCGPGHQSIALAKAGFRVVALDFCDELLGELRQRAGDLAIRVVNDDIMNFAQHVTEPPELIVCMGDTLVHLPEEQAVQSLLVGVAESLRAGGTFVVSLRDYSTPPPLGPDRFIPVRSSDDRIFTCFLEYRGKTIEVHDILYTRRNGEWQLEVSHYQKLCLDYRSVIGTLEQQGLKVGDVSDHRGMKVIVARKPA